MMKRTNLSFLLLPLAVFWGEFESRSVQAQEPQWKLVWSDEFDGKKLDYSKWEIEVNAFGGGNQEEQIYTDRAKNVRVADGLLVIEAHKDNAGIAGTTRTYSSGRIRSKNRGDWLYGRFEFRAKLLQDRDCGLRFGCCRRMKPMEHGRLAEKSTFWSSKGKNRKRPGERYTLEGNGRTTNSKGRSTTYRKGHSRKSSMSLLSSGRKG